ncbi:hypothetical protein VIGAN_03167700, partial [Vigna angularis var. angularis]
GLSGCGSFQGPCASNIIPLLKLLDPRRCSIFFSLLHPCCYHLLDTKLLLSAKHTITSFCSPDFASQLGVNVLGAPLHSTLDRFPPFSPSWTWIAFQNLLDRAKQMGPWVLLENARRWGCGKCFCWTVDSKSHPPCFGRAGLHLFFVHLQTQDREGCCQVWAVLLLWTPRASAGC